VTTRVTVASNNKLKLNKKVLVIRSWGPELSSDDLRTVREFSHVVAVRYSDRGPYVGTCTGARTQRGSWMEREMAVTPGTLPTSYDQAEP
jgi:hypothetical protein